MLNKEKFKQLCLGLGIYRPVRRIYDRINPSRVEAVRESREVLKEFLRPGDLCFDVGANVGRKTEALLGIGARVVAVEPQPRCLRELQALFGGDPKFMIVPKAVGREPGTAKMHVSSQSTVSSLRADWFHRWDAEIDVEITTLDTLIATHGIPRYIKMDIEGFELEALRGLSTPVDYLSFEYNIRFIDQAYACIDYLTRFGAMRLNFSLMEDSRLLAGDNAWWDRETFDRRFREELERNPENWGGDIFVRIEEVSNDAQA